MLQGIRVRHDCDDNENQVSIDYQEELMKAWITKYAHTNNIQEVDGEISKSSQTMLIVQGDKYPMYRRRKRLASYPDQRQKESGRNAAS